MQQTVCIGKDAGTLKVKGWKITASKWKVKKKQD
jgi:hypothetical protein